MLNLKGFSKSYYSEPHRGVKSKRLVDVEGHFHDYGEPHWGVKSKPAGWLLSPPADYSEPHQGRQNERGSEIREQNAMASKTAY